MTILPLCRFRLRSILKWPPTEFRLLFSKVGPRQNFSLTSNEVNKTIKPFYGHKNSNLSPTTRSKKYIYIKVLLSRCHLTLFFSCKWYHVYCHMILASNHLVCLYTCAYIVSLCLPSVHRGGDILLYLCPLCLSQSVSPIHFSPRWSNTRRVENVENEQASTDFFVVRQYTGCYTREVRHFLFVWSITKEILSGVRNVIAEIGDINQYWCHSHKVRLLILLSCCLPPECWS